MTTLFPVSVSITTKSEFRDSGFSIFNTSHNSKCVYIKRPTGVVVSFPMLLVRSSHKHQLDYSASIVTVCALDITCVFLEYIDLITGRQACASSNLTNVLTHVVEQTFVLFLILFFLKFGWWGSIYYLLPTFSFIFQDSFPKTGIIFRAGHI